MAVSQTKKPSIEPTYLPATGQRNGGRRVHPHGAETSRGWAGRGRAGLMTDMTGRGLDGMMAYSGLQWSGSWGLWLRVCVWMGGMRRLRPPFAPLTLRLHAWHDGGCVLVLAVVMVVEAWNE